MAGGNGGCLCHGSVLGREMTSVISGPVTPPVLSLLEETGQ